MLEIGSRDGDNAMTLAQAFDIPLANVHAVECNPKAITLIKTKWPGINIHTHAIFNRNGEKTFFSIDPDEHGLVTAGQSSLIDRVDKKYDQYATKVTVNCMTGRRFLESLDIDGFDLCKIDVEGASYEVLESFEDKLKQIKSLHVECEHREVWEGQRTYEYCAHLLLNNGFKQVFFLCHESLQSDSVWVQNAYL
ncbi:MAG: FkbM family methyltransferase [Usitatibacteraceae bacterium]